MLVPASMPPKFPGIAPPVLPDWGPCEGTAPGLRCAPRSNSAILSLFW